MGQEMLANHAFDKGLIIKIHEGLTQLHSKETDKLI